jgi:hypothetical protein
MLKRFHGFSPFSPQIVSVGNSLAQNLCLAQETRSAATRLARAALFWL